MICDRQESSVRSYTGNNIPEIHVESGDTVDEIRPLKETRVGVNESMLFRYIPDWVEDESDDSVIIRSHRLDTIPERM